jgi:uncharacterized membrane protein YccC
MQWLGQACIGKPWLMLPVLAGMLLIMAMTSRCGLHKGMQFWVFGLLLANMMPTPALPAWQHALLAFCGAVYGCCWVVTAWRLAPGVTRRRAR